MAISDTSASAALNGSEIAIIGMACRFPGANNLECFWQLLSESAEAITFFTADELQAAGVAPAVLENPHYIRAAPILDRIDGFDAAFFGCTPLEARLMDPQQRILLECAAEALEHAGYDPERFPGAIGVYAGARSNTYLIFNVLPNADLIRAQGYYQQVALGNDLALLSTRISYKLNLRGPSYTIQTACSTGLVAVHLACQSLLIDECQLALAGAVAINVPHNTGYYYEPGNILSPDGHCRPFDAQAQGTVFGSGAGMVVLKRLADALADGDTIHAVIKGSATNNDGALKAAFTAPSVDGQTNVITEALAVADVHPDTISYVEGHGTATPLGDPIEVAALTKAYRAATTRSGFCALGSVKANLGHLDAAAGIAGLIKTVLALTHQQIPPTPHFQSPNPQIDFANTPFYVANERASWPATPDAPRRAAVSSFGIGGTNAHIILEEAPQQPASAPAPEWQLLPLAAKTPAALDALTAQLQAYLAQSPAANLADVAYTLQYGRQHFAQRRCWIVRDLADARAALADPSRVTLTPAAAAAPPLPRTGDKRSAEGGLAGGEGRLALLETLAQRWLAGDAIDWAALVGDTPRRRLALPTYPFARQRYWIEPPPTVSAASLATPALDALAEAIDADTAPSMRIELRLAQIWQELFGIEQVCGADNFWELGGDSLIATQLLSRLRAAFRTELPLSTLFEAPTVTQLAEQIALVQQATSAQHSLAITPVARTGPPPLSFAQQRLWFLDQFEPGSPYHVPAALRCAGQLNLAALAHSLNAIVKRHEVLRTTFATINGEPVQAITPTLTIGVPLLDLRGLPAPKREAVALRLAALEHQRPFDLARGPLIRVALLRLAPTEHMLLLTMHHIISDGWSIGVLVREVAAIYEGAVAGAPALLPALPIQYADFAHWQRTWLAGSVLDAQLAYWQRQLADARHAVQLPTDRPRPAIQTYRGATRSMMLADELGAQLKAHSQAAGATLFMVLLAPFQALLQRYSGQDDLLVGTPVANRHRLELEGLIGFFVNTLVLRARLAGNPSFNELLNRIREDALGAYAHQDVPFERLVEAIVRERDMSRNPLFQVMFTLQNTPMPSVTFRDLTLQLLPIASETAKFDLSLDIVETAHGLLMLLEYNTDLFDAATIQRMLGHYQTLLAQSVTQPTQPIATLPLLSPAERHQLLVEWNRVREERPREARIHIRFEAQAARTPDAVALVFDETKDERRTTKEDLSGFVLRPSSFVVHVTYAELNRRANQLARHLHTIGVAAGAHVGIFMERSPELIIAVLGVLKAGAAYVAIDATQAKERLAFVLDDSRAAVLITTREDKETGRPGDKEIDMLLVSLSPCLALVDLAVDWPLIATRADTNPAFACVAEQLAYIVYTSGSTGLPKGTLISHSSLTSAYESWACDYRLTEADNHLQMASCSFDVFAGDLVRALCSGGKLVLCPHAFLLEPEQIFTLMWHEAINVAEFVPAVLRNLLLYVARRGRSLAQMRLLIAGSDSWSLSEMQHVHSFCGPHTRLINSYGVTEATIDSSYFEWRPRMRSAGSLVPIGRPYRNTQLYVLDRQLQPVPIGVPGELHIGGASVAYGYLNRPDLTAERFVPNPFGDCRLQIADCRLPQSASDGRWPMADGSVPRSAIDGGWPMIDGNVPQSAICNLQSAIGTRLYKTGDQVSYQSDGTLVFLGRIDQQVKLRGFRIELGEIAAVLTTHPALKTAIVVLREDVPGDQRLVAYVVPDCTDAISCVSTTNDHRTDAIRTDARYCVSTTNDHRTDAIRTDAKSCVSTTNDHRTDAISCVSTGDDHANMSFVQELREHLGQTLPSYMLPTSFVLLDALPLTPSGKVDRQALPAPEQAAHERAYVAPANADEQIIADIWQTLLGVAQVSTHDSFFALGGHSLLVSQLIFQLQDAFQLDIPLRALFETPTIVELARVIAVMRGKTAPDNDPNVVDLQREATLDPTIIPATPARAPSPAPSDPPHALLLTGATGFLGAYLLHDLLEQTEADVYCLVRATNAAAGRQAIERNLAAYQLDAAQHSARIIPLLGDLAQPHLGLGEQAVHMLADRIDSIYHCGAWVNFTYPYAALKATNVSGTEAILRLAALGRTKPVHLISTLSVFSAHAYAGPPILEDDPLDHSDGLLDGYAQSKWVAEKLALLARARGIPVSIYRAGRISGHSRTGICHTKDLVWALIKGCIQLGSAPDIELDVDLAPVDFVSGAIARLSLQPTTANRAFHLFNPHVCSWRMIVDWLTAYGYPVRRLAYDEWQAALVNAIRHDANALGPFLPLFPRRDATMPAPDTLQKLQFDQRNTRAGLAGTAISCPPINAQLLSRYIDHLVRSGFLEAPSTARRK